ncbi:MAG: sugar nucleotide-binding protein, partial [Clostridiales bacterium]|nr:sugar nucleotide-binding protein [Clostridiales bacterium]
EFACEIFKLAGIDIKVNPIKSEDYPTKAKRPKNSRLSLATTTLSNFKPMQNYKKAICELLQEVNDDECM